MAELIPISRIEIPVKFRMYGSVDVSDLKASLDAEGQKVPIKVKRRGESYVLVDGYRRIQAALQLRWIEIKAEVEPFTSMEDLIKEAITINQMRKPFSNLDKACLFKYWLDNEMHDRNTIARWFGFRSPDTVTNYVGLTQHPQEIQNHIHEGLLGIEIALKLRRVPEEERVRVARDYVEGRITRMQLETIIDSYPLLISRRAEIIEEEEELPTEITRPTGILERPEEVSEIPIVEEGVEEREEEISEVLQEGMEERIRCPVKEELRLALIRSEAWEEQRDENECEQCNVRFMCPFFLRR